MSSSKNDLQTFCARNGLGPIDYKTVFVGGYAHEPLFQSTVVVGKYPPIVLCATGEKRSSKKEAEKSAAGRILMKLTKPSPEDHKIDSSTDSGEIFFQDEMGTLFALRRNRGKNGVLFLVDAETCSPFIRRVLDIRDNKQYTSVSVVGFCTSAYKNMHTLRSTEKVHFIQDNADDPQGVVARMTAFACAFLKDAKSVYKVRKLVIVGSSAAAAALNGARLALKVHNNLIDIECLDDKEALQLIK